ncbi:MAG: metal ABC transporter permease [Gammaproteobacteria bacterium]|nr:metal ABC transporter permease [Gammaproteobacteria bacterium]
MMEFFNAVLEYRFLQYAVLACLLASIGCGVVGSYVVVKKLGSLAGGIAHAVLAGMGIAYFFGESPLLGATIMSLVSAVFIGMINLRLKQNEDILVAAFWSVGMAIGILFISRTPGYNINLMSYLFGNILLVTGKDLVHMLILDIMVLIIVRVFYRQFLAAAFDEEYARVRGVNVEAYYILMLSMVALTVVLLIQIVGLIMVIALLVLPTASVSLFVGSLPRIMFYSVILCAMVMISGLALSFQPDLPSGAMIILVAGAVYSLSLLVYSQRNRKLN